MNTQQIYIWHGINTQGQRITGEVSAPTLNLAKNHLLKNKIQFSTLQRKRKSWLPSKHRITSTDLILFFRQLSTLIVAGIPITQAITLMCHIQEHNKLLPILESIKNDLHAGHDFYSSLRKFPQHFDSITCNLVEAGEKSGTFDIMLQRIATYKESARQLKNKIVQALFYPTMTIVVAIISSFIMLAFIVPRFATLFQTMHRQLPAFTRCVIGIADFLNRFSGWILFLTITAIFALYYAQRRPRIRRIFDRLLLALPLLGTQLTKFILARFTRTLALIFNAGIPITEALKILTHSTGNLLYAQALQKLHQNISSGKQLHLAMQNNALFPTLLQQMVRIGEESGTLDQMLHKIADFYESDLDYFIANLSKLLEPLIMIILGVLIGGLVIAMYLPLFKLGTVI